MSSVFETVLFVYERTLSLPEPLWLAAWGAGLIVASLGLRAHNQGATARASRKSARPKSLGAPVTQSHG